jgi:hypothetical protein
MKNKPNIIKIPVNSAVLFTVAVMIISSLIGYKIAEIKTQKSGTSLSKDNPQAIKEFKPEKTEKPVLDFYVMSFCPFGNQIEDLLRPVFDLMGDKVELQPRYIFDKIENITENCKARADVNQCEAYIKNGYFKTLAECKKVVGAEYTKCMDTTAYIKSPTGAYYSALHGRVEANQNVREICAFNLTEDKKMWWDFVDNVNEACDYKNADTCWEEQAKKAGYDTAKITECFNKDGIALIEKEISFTDKNKIQASPTVLINGIQFPPDEAYAQDGKGAMKIGKVTIPQTDFRSPNALKEGVCAGFKKSPKECKTNIKAEEAVAPQGGC